MPTTNFIRIYPLDLITDKAIGVALPFIPNNSYLFSCNYTMYDQIKTNIRNLLMTEKGERIMVPSYGCSLRRKLFEPVQLMDSLEEEIRNSIETWLPLVNVETIEVNQDSRNEHLFTVKIDFSLKYSKQVDTLVIELKQPE